MDRRICKAFGNTERLRLIVCLARPQSVSELLTKCSLSQSALSQHLKILRDARIVTGVRTGKQMIYRVTRKPALSIAQELLSLSA